LSPPLNPRRAPRPQALRIGAPPRRKCIGAHAEAQLREKASVSCPSCGAGLAGNPFESAEKGVKYDYAKDDLIKSLFPRGEIDRQAERERQEIDARRREERRLAGGNDPKMSEEEYYRRRLQPGKKPEDRNKRIRQGLKKSQHGGVTTHEALHLRMVPDDMVHDERGKTTLPPLSKPFLRVPANMPVSGLSKFLQAVLPDLEVRTEEVELVCMGLVLDPAQTCRFTYETLWRPYHDPSAMMVVHYRDMSKARPVTIFPGR